MIKKNVSLVIADDHPLMLLGLKQELEQAGFSIIHEAKNGADALKQIVELNPDVAILDLKMPIMSGLEVIMYAKKEPVKTKFIIMTYHDSKAFIFKAKQVGVKGYLLKEDDIHEIEKCIVEVLDGKEYYSAALQIDVERFFKHELHKIGLLTSSERTILRLITKSMSSDDIGKQLSISKRTVEKHRSNIIAKLDLKKGTSITQWAINNIDLINEL